MLSGNRIPEVGWTAVIKREWWNEWTEDIPQLDYIIQSYDTAYSKKETADFSAITTWGVFEPCQW